MLRPRWRKVLADLWGNKVRTLLVVASIGVGVFAIGVIAGTYIIIDHDLNQSYTATQPAHITLLTFPFDPGFVDSVRNMDGVAAAEGRRQAQLQIRIAPGTWDNITLIAIPDYDKLQVHLHQPIAGQPVPLNRQVVLEHKSLADLGYQVGDTLQIELPDGTLRPLAIVGTVRDQSDVYGSILGDLQGFITDDTLEWLHQPLDLNQLYVAVTDRPHTTQSSCATDESCIRQIADAVTDRLEQSGHEVYRTSITVGSEHPLNSIVGALLTVLIILGILVVFLSGSLIANTMSALLTQHLRQIGVIKLIGGSRQQVIGMYLALIVSFGLIALAGTIVPGSWGAYRLARFVGDIMNFQVRDFHMIPAAIAFQIAIALVVPPIAGLLPVLKGSRITVQQALTSTGLSEQSHGKGWIDRRLEGLRRISRPLLISIRNTFRRKSRLALTLLTLTLGGAIFIAVFNAQVALNLKMEQLSRYFGADINLDMSRSYRIPEITREAQSIAGIERVEVWISTGAEIIHSDKTDPLALIAPPADSSLVNPTLLAGRWLLPDDQNAIAVNEAFWDDYPNLELGSTLRLKLAEREDDWVVVGVFQYSGMSDLVAYANYDYVAQVLNTGDHAAVYRIVTSEHTLEFQEQVGARLNTHLRDRGFQVDKVEAGRSLVSSITDVLGILTAVLLVMALLTALVGSIGLMGTMSMNILERTREIGVMRAVGAHNRILSSLVIVEGLLIGLISYVLGAILSFPITLLLSNVISVAIFNSPAQFAFTLQGFLIWLGVVVLLSVLSSILPARNASRLTIREVLAYE